MAAGSGLDLPPFPGPARFGIEKHMVDDDTPEKYLQGILTGHPVEARMWPRIGTPDAGDLAAIPTGSGQRALTATGVITPVGPP